MPQRSSRKTKKLEQRDALRTQMSGCLSDIRAYEFWIEPANLEKRVNEELRIIKKAEDTIKSYQGWHEKAKNDMEPAKKRLAHLQKQVSKLKDPRYDKIEKLKAELKRLEQEEKELVGK